jgi:AcrR family transcriptional regulator
MAAPAVSAPELDRRSRRKAESRRRLLAAARRLFAERGYHATRPADIAAAADVASGTFYLHFADKREAFLAFVEEAAAEIEAGIAVRVEGLRGFEARLYGALDALLDYGESHPGVLRAAFADPSVIAPGEEDAPGLRERFAATLAQGLRQGVVRGEIHGDYDPELIAHGIVGMVQQACSGWSGSDRASLLRNLTLFCSRALVAECLREEGSAT